MTENSIFISLVDKRNAAGMFLEISVLVVLCHSACLLSEQLTVDWKISQILVALMCTLKACCSWKKSLDVLPVGRYTHCNKISFVNEELVIHNWFEVTAAMDSFWLSTVWLIDVTLPKLNVNKSQYMQPQSVHRAFYMTDHNWLINSTHTSTHINTSYTDTQQISGFTISCN